MTERSYAVPGRIAPGITKRCESLHLSPDLCKEYAQALATILQIEFDRSDDFPALAPAELLDRGGSRFRPATEFIEENLDREISLCELASMVALSVSHFAHAFKAEYGVSPYHYIIVRRIERAKTLLRTTDDTITSIAQQVGFASNAHFSRSFAKIAGLTPSAYRDTLILAHTVLPTVTKHDAAAGFQRAAVHRSYTIRRGGVLSAAFSRSQSGRSR